MGDRTGRGHSAQVTALHFSPDGTQILSSSLDKKLILWDPESGTEVLSLSGHAEPIYASCYLGADGRVVSGSYDRTVKLWDIGGTDDRRVSAPAKRAALENVAGPTGLVRGAPKGDGSGTPAADGDGTAESILSATPVVKARGGGGKAAVSQGRRVFGLRHAQVLEDEKGPMAPAGAHSDRVQVRAI